MIASSDALKGVHSRYQVEIQTLTYKGFEIGDVPMFWRGCNIYNQFFRENCATKEDGLDRDYTAPEMLKMYKDLCADFNISLDKDDKVIPQNQTLQCADFWGKNLFLIWFKNKQLLKLFFFIFKIWLSFLSPFIKG